MSDNATSQQAPADQQGTQNLDESFLKLQAEQQAYYQKQEAIKLIGQGLTRLSDMSHGQDLTDLVKKYVSLLSSL